MATASLPDNNDPHQSALRFLYDRVDYERALAIPYSPWGLKLCRMRDLLDRLGSPDRQLAIVHVAGTKGKGSTAAMIAAVLTAAGYRTGLFTSPHLDRVEERIALDGQPCSGDELVELVRRVQPAIREIDEEAAREHPADGGPTFFEITTAMALVHFAARGARAAVLEVGLGGRLDSTNVCQPRIAVITSISFDHVKQLGNTLESIARRESGDHQAGRAGRQRRDRSRPPRSHPRDLPAPRLAAGRTGGRFRLPLRAATGTGPPRRGRAGGFPGGGRVQGSGSGFGVSRA